jgi:hypothetical protein
MALWLVAQLRPEPGQIGGTLGRVALVILAGIVMVVARTPVEQSPSARQQSR